MTTVPLGTVLRLRKDVVHPRDNPTGAGTFVGLEHVEPASGQRVGSFDIDLSKLTGRKPRFFRGDIVYGYLRPYLTASAVPVARSTFVPQVSSIDRRRCNS
jgi:hypothetical protein